MSLTMRIPFLRLGRLVNGVTGYYGFMIFGHCIGFTISLYVMLSNIYAYSYLYISNESSLSNSILLGVKCTVCGPGNENWDCLAQGKASDPAMVSEAI